jgi:hypothetical protein
MNPPRKSLQTLKRELAEVTQREAEFVTRADALLDKAHSVAHDIEERVHAAILREDTASHPLGHGPHVQPS